MKSLPEYIKFIFGLFKVVLSSSKEICFICFNESPLKTKKNTFYLILKAVFVIKIFNFFLNLLVM